MGLIVTLVLFTLFLTYLLSFMLVFTVDVLKSVLGRGK